MIGAWNNLDDVELFVRPKYGWICNFLTFAEVDRSSGRAVATVPATYPMTCEITHLEGTENRPCWLENYLEVLDQPGEWVYDSVARRIYLWPTDGEPGDDICYPTLTEIIRIEGDEANQRFPQHLKFEGITFLHGARETLTPTDAGVQHDWDMWDKDNALVRLRGAERIAVVGCRFTASSGGGIRLDRHAKHNRIDGNTVEHLGGTGILLCGYGPGTLDVNKQNRVINNTVHNCAEISGTVWESWCGKVVKTRSPTISFTTCPTPASPFSGCAPPSSPCRTIARTAAPSDMTRPVGSETVPRRCRGRMFSLSCMPATIGFRTMSCTTPARQWRTATPSTFRVAASATRSVSTTSTTWYSAIITARCAPTIGPEAAAGITTSCGTAPTPVSCSNMTIRWKTTCSSTFGAPLIGCLVVRRDPCDHSSVNRNVFLNSVDENLSFVKLEKAQGLKEVDKNVYWAAANETWAQEALQEMRDQGFEANGAVTEVRFKEADGLDFRVEPNGQLEELGIHGVDLRDVGPA